MILRRHRTCPLANLDLVGGTAAGNSDRVPPRTAVQWFKLQVGTDGLTYSAHERIYDAASSNPYWYHFPSLNVNAAGDLLVGFSGCKATEYIGTFYRGRKANGVWQTRPYLVKAGRDSFNYSRWGDYSATSLDPTDDSFWTIQQYAESDPADHQMWGT